MKINLQAPINGLGYGVAGLNLTRSLMQAGHEAALFHIPSKHSWRQDLEIPADYFPCLIDAELNCSDYDVNAPSVRMWMQNDLAQRVGRGLHVGFPFFELTRFTAEELHHLRSVDRIFVASQWAKQVVLESGVVGHSNEIRVVPLGVDREIFNEVCKDASFFDYTIFVNVGKWEIRKGHDVLLEAFRRAFTPRDKVLLKMACSNPFIGNANEEWASRYRNALGNAVQIYGRLTSQKTVSKLLAEADCGVFPARAEGWNLDLLETLAVGTHAIATNYSAHTEYINKDNCRLININRTETANDGIWFKGQGEWAEFGDEQMDELIHHLREVHRLKQTGQLGRNLAGIETSKQFSWQNSADAFVKGLQE